METLEELKAIVAGAPDGATHVKSNPDFNDVILYYKKVNTKLFFFLGDRLVDVAVKMEASRSLSDIERIIELMELNKEMHLTVSGYLYGDEWNHWNKFNAGKFKL